MLNCLQESAKNLFKDLARWILAKSSCQKTCHIVQDLSSPCKVFLVGLADMLDTHLESVLELLQRELLR